MNTTLFTQKSKFCIFFSPAMIVYVIWLRVWSVLTIILAIYTEHFQQSYKIDPHHNVLNKPNKIMAKF